MWFIWRCGGIYYYLVLVSLCVWHWSESVGEKTLIIIKMHGMYVKKKKFWYIFHWLLFIMPVVTKG